MKAIPILLWLIVTGCMVGGGLGPTHYQKKGDGTFDNFGYMETKVDSTNYEVVFVGSGSTTPQVVERYALYRAAEITNEHGYDYFVVQNNANQANSPGSDMEVDVTYHASKTDPNKVDPATKQEQERRDANADFMSHNVLINHKTIRLFHGSKPAADTNAIDAKKMLHDVGPLIER